MKTISSISCAALLAGSLQGAVWAQAPTAESPVAVEDFDAAKYAVPAARPLTEQEQGRLGRHIAIFIETINEAEPLEDKAKEAKAREIMAAFYPRFWDWHTAHDAQINELWEQWAAARTPPEQNEAKAKTFTDEIAKIYEPLKAFYEEFMADLATVLTEKQIEGIKNRVTRSPGLERTYNAYCAVIPEMTDEQKKFVYDNFYQAREEGMLTHSGKEVERIFKKYKVINEAYLNDQGYDWKTRYRQHFYPDKS